MRDVSLGIDVEPDCPPYLATQYRGMEEGLPAVLEVLREAGVAVTCFTTGEVAERYPDAIRAIIGGGHELACHGHTHARFDRMADADARREVEASSRALRSFGVPVTSFRAPNLQLPHRHFALLEESGYQRDSSTGKHKAAYYRSPPRTTLRRIPASTTSSVLRLDRWIRDPFLLSLSSPVVLFVHPWEFVDLTRERLRLDCRFRTGKPALEALRSTIELFQRRRARFLRLDQVPAPQTAA
jgi:peptidoglycan/xylan/chitin deacetylase (PgdA/CDA1 family)